MTSPTQLSLKEMRSRGYRCEVVEYWHHFAKCRKDLFGIIDILCLGNGETIGLQTTDYTSISKHRTKALESENLRPWLLAGNRYVLHGWKKKDTEWLLIEENFEIPDEGKTH